MSPPTPPPSTYVRRVQAVLAALDHLREAGPLPVDELADAVGVRDGELRDDLGPLLEAGLVDVTDGDAYAVTGVEPLRALGLDRLGVADAAALVLLGRAWSELVPAAPALRSALDSLERLTLAGPAAAALGPGPTGAPGSVGARLRHAVDEHRAARIVYARAWRPGVVERVVHPYALVLTRRGWECDAGPLDDALTLRTYLLSGIQEVELLGPVPPPGLIARDTMRSMRRPRTVTLVLPQGSRWVAEAYAERVRVVRQDADLQLECDLLPPVDQRVGLILVTAGPGSMAVDADLADAGQRYAEDLLALYGGRC